MLEIVTSGLLTTDSAIYLPVVLAPKERNKKARGNAPGIIEALA
jgi:hypothetical protein